MPPLKVRLRHMVASTLLAGASLFPGRSSGQGKRLRLMLRHTWLLGLFATFLIVGLVGALFWYASRPTIITLAVGPANSEDAKMVQALSQQFRKDRVPFRLHPLILDGPAQAATAVDSRQADLAIVRRDYGYPRGAGSVAIWRENVMLFVVPATGSPAALAAEAKASAGAKGKPAAKGKAAAKKSAKGKGEGGVEKIEDLPGKRVGVIGLRGDNVDVLNVVLRQYEIPPDKVTIVPLDPDNVSGAVRDTPVDVIFGAGPKTARFFSDAIMVSTKPGASTKDKEVAPTFLAIGASEAIAARQPVYESTEIKEGSFGGHKAQPEDDIETLGFNYYIVAAKALPDSTVGDFTKQLFASRQSLVSEYPAFAKIEKPDTDKDASVPAHPGAAAFIDDDQKTFFDKYSDFIYLGLMLASGFGSGAAWLASYSSADARLKRMKVLERLLEILKQARAVTTPDALDRLRGDVDELLVRTIRMVERNEIDEQAVRAFALAFDQAGAAIADRRASLSLAPSGAAQSPAPADAAASPRGGIETDIDTELPSAAVTPLRASG